VSRFKLETALRATKPCGQRERLSACAHCASVPKYLRNSGIDMPYWNWIWWLGIRALRHQESSDDGLSGALDESAEAGLQSGHTLDPRHKKAQACH
jgi:hypothetical protein